MGAYNSDPVDFDYINKNAGDRFAVWQGGSVSWGDFQRHATAMADRLPAGKYVLNLCEDRYLFCVTLFAAALRGQINLLPPSRSPGILEELARDYGPVHAVCDRDDWDLAFCESLVIGPLQPCGPTPECPLDLDQDQVIAIAFTSGSTGKPKAWAKRWGSLVTCAALALTRLELTERPLAMVSTTPPQHMYGLEAAVLWPFISQLVLVGRRPFYPEDIRRTLSALMLPAILISTPSHLQACAASGGHWSNLTGVLSSTAPMSAQLAKQIEQQMQVPVHEIYGSTETLSFASRRTVQDESWTPYEGVKLEPQDEGCVLRALFLPAPVVLDDRLRILPDGRFTVEGRNSDLVKIAGKRASLAALNLGLTNIDGVSDGVMFECQRGHREARLAAIVVTTRSRDEILDELRHYLDEVFLPRRIYFVDHIPRNEVGKLSRNDLNEMIAALQSD